MSITAEKMTTTMDRPTSENLLLLDLPLTDREANQLRRCEAMIEEGLVIFYKVGNALMTIRNAHLYRANHKTFEAYFAHRFGLKRSSAYRWIDAAEVVNNLLGGDSPDADGTPGSDDGQSVALPANEAQARPLVGLPAEVQREVWRDVTAGPEPVTAARVKEAVDRVTGRTDDQHSSPEMSPIGDKTHAMPVDGTGGAELSLPLDEMSLPLDIPAGADSSVFPFAPLAYAAPNPVVTTTEPVIGEDSASETEPTQSPLIQNPLIDVTPSAVELVPTPAPAAAPPSVSREDRIAEEERVRAAIQAKHEAGKAYRQSLLDARTPQIATALATLGDSLGRVAEALPAGSPAARALAVLVAYALAESSGAVLSETIESLGLPINYEVIDGGWEEFAECFEEFARCDGAALLRLGLGTIVRDEQANIDANHLRCPALDWFSPADTEPVTALTVAAVAAVLQESQSDGDGEDGTTSPEEEAAPDRPAFRVFGPAADEQECARCNALIDMAALDELAGAGPEIKSPVTAKDGTLLTPHWVLYCPECAPDEAICRVCGCTYHSACEGGCYWAESDLCSACSACVDADKKPDSTVAVVGGSGPVVSAEVPQASEASLADEVAAAADRIPWRFSPREFTGAEPDADGVWRGNPDGMKVWDAHRWEVLKAIGRSEDVPECAIEGHDRYLRGRWEHLQAALRGDAPAWDRHCRFTVWYGDGDKRIELVVDHFPMEHGHASRFEFHGPQEGWFSTTGFTSRGTDPMPSVFPTPLDYAQAYADWEMIQSRLPKKKQSNRGFDSDVARGVYVVPTPTGQTQPVPAPLDAAGDPAPPAPEPGPFLTMIQDAAPVLRSDPWDAVQDARVSEPSPDRTAFVSAEFIDECTAFGVYCGDKIGGKNSIVEHPVTFEGELYAVVGTAFQPGGGREAFATRMVPKERWGGPINLHKQLHHTYFGMEATHDGKPYVLEGGTVTFKLAGSEEAVSQSEASGVEEKSAGAEGGRVVARVPLHVILPVKTLIEYGRWFAGDTIRKKSPAVAEAIQHDGQLWAITGEGNAPSPEGHGRIMSLYTRRMVPRGEFTGETHTSYNAAPDYRGLIVRHKGADYVLDGMPLTFENAPLIRPADGDLVENTWTGTTGRIDGIVGGPSGRAAKVVYDDGLTEVVDFDRLSRLPEADAVDTDEVCLGVGCKNVIPGSVVFELCHTPGAYLRDVIAHDGTVLREKGKILCPSCAAKEVLPSPYPDSPITDEYFVLTVLGKGHRNAVGENDPVFTPAVDARRLAVPGVPDYDLFTHSVQWSPYTERRALKIADGRSGTNLCGVESFDEAKAWVQTYHQEGLLRGWMDKRVGEDFPRSPRYVVPAPAPSPAKPARQRKGTGKTAADRTTVATVEPDPYAPEPDLCRLCKKNRANFFGTCDECDGTFHEVSDDVVSDQEAA